jgi:hypothetical protein
VPRVTSAPPLVLVRLLLVAVPFLAALTVGIALFYLYGAVLAARQGNTPFALLYGVLSIGGIALGVALWRTWRKARESVRSAPRGG